LCAYVYFETEPDAETATKLRTRDESRRIAANIAKLSKPQGACRDLVERFQSSNHMGCSKRPHPVDGKPKMQLSSFMESVV
jgi:hypothetical protein